MLLFRLFVSFHFLSRTKAYTCDDCSTINCVFCASLHWFSWCSLMTGWKQTTSTYMTDLQEIGNNAIVYIPVCPKLLLKIMENHGFRGCSCFRVSHHALSSVGSQWSHAMPIWLMKSWGIRFLWPKWKCSSTHSEWVTLSSSDPKRPAFHSVHTKQPNAPVSDLLCLTLLAEFGLPPKQPACGAQLICESPEVKKTSTSWN